MPMTESTPSTTPRRGLRCPTLPSGLTTEEAVDTLLRWCEVSDTDLAEVTLTPATEPPAALGGSGAPRT